MSRERAIIEAINASELNRGRDGAAWLAGEGNVAIVLDRDIALFDDEGDGVFQGHFLFHSRGKDALASARESFRQMFEDHDAVLLFGLVPDFRRDVKMLVRWAGAKATRIHETIDGPCELFVLSKEMWSRKCPS